MLRRSAPGLIVAAGVVVTLLHSCTPFGAGVDAVPDASGAGDGSGGDGGNGAESGADGMAIADATIDSPELPDAGDCLSLATGFAPFTAAGSVSVQGGGTRLHMTPGATTTLTHTFPRPTAFTKSTVDMLVQMTFSSTSWVNYLDLLQLGYGDSVNYGSNAVTSLELSGAGVEVNSWFAPNQYDMANSGPMNPPLLKPSNSTGDVRFIVKTTWATSGEVEVTIGGAPSKKSLKTKTTANGSLLTLVIGGASGLGIPTLDLLVKQVCVTFE